DPVAFLADSARRFFRVDLQQERAIGQLSADRRQVQLEHAVDAEAARDSLVRERGIEIAVADDDRSALDGGGDHAVDELRAGARGDEVHVLDSLATGSHEKVPVGAELHPGDIRSDAAGLFDAVDPDVCIHTAAQADVGTSVERPDYDADVNVLGTIRVLEAARAHGTHVVFGSTGGAIYGECDGPAAEDAPRQPISPYGISKLAGEAYVGGWNRPF